MSDRQADMPTGNSTAPPIGDLLERLMDEAEQGQIDTADTPVKILPPDVPAVGAPEGGVLGGLLSNPAILSALPQLISGLGMISKGPASADNRGNRSVDKDTVSASSAVKAPVGSLHPDRHTALLCALKPYLGSERQQAAEYLISLCRVWNTLQGMGINIPALLLSGQGGVSQHQDKEV